MYAMELHEANRILRSVKSALAADGIKLPPSAETDGLMMLLDKLDCEKFLMPKIKHARAAAQDSAAYKRNSAYLAFFRALDVMKNGISDPVTSVSIMLLHKYVCGDLDENAGKPRASECLTGGAAHTDPKYISGSLKAVVTKMNDIASAPALGKEDFAGYITHYMRELIIMHPFEHGSEFTLRLFLMLFCKLKGFSLCYYRSPAQAIKSAEDEAFLADDISPLYKIFMNCLSYEHTVSAPQARLSPRTRREITNRVRPDPPPKQTDATIEPIKSKASDQPQVEQDEEVLRRAIKLQQKITKLNEQLTELMTKSTRSGGKQGEKSGHNRKPK